MSNPEIVVISTRELGPDINPANINYSLNPPLQLKGAWEVALIDGSYVNTVANVSPALKNNTFRYHNGDEDWKTITLQLGTYAVSNFQSFLEEVMDPAGDYEMIDGNKVYGIMFNIDLALARITVTLAKNYVLDLTNNGTSKLNELLGFDAAPITSSGTTVAPHPAKISDRLQFFLIKTNLISRGVRINNTTDGILDVIQNGAFGFPVSFRSPDGEYQYYPVNRSYIDSIQMQVLDQDRQVVEFNGEHVVYKLKFRPIGSGRR